MVSLGLEIVRKMRYYCHGDLCQRVVICLLWITMWMSGRLIDLKFIIEVVFEGSERCMQTHLFSHAVLDLD